MWSGEYEQLAAKITKLSVKHEYFVLATQKTTVAFQKQLKKVRETQAEQQKRLDDLENTTIKMSKTRSKSDSKQAHVSVKVEVEEMKSQLASIQKTAKTADLNLWNMQESVQELKNQLKDCETGLVKQEKLAKVCVKMEKKEEKNSVEGFKTFKPVSRRKENVNHSVVMTNVKEGKNPIEGEKIVRAKVAQLSGPLGKEFAIKKVSRLGFHSKFSRYPRPIAVQFENETEANIFLNGYEEFCHLDGAVRVRKFRTKSQIQSYKLRRMKRVRRRARYWPLCLSPTFDRPSYMFGAS